METPGMYRGPPAAADIASPSVTNGIKCRHSTMHPGVDDVMPGAGPPGQRGCRPRALSLHCIALPSCQCHRPASWHEHSTTRQTAAAEQAQASQLAAGLASVATTTTSLLHRRGSMHACCMHVQKGLIGYEYIRPGSLQLGLLKCHGPFAAPEALVD